MGMEAYVIPINSTLAIIAYFLIFKLFLIPSWKKGKSSKTILMLLISFHFFRFLPMGMLIPGLDNQLPSLDPTFVLGMIYGDFISAILAMIAVITLHYRPRQGIVMAWIFSLFGFIDLVLVNLLGAPNLIGASVGILPYLIVSIYTPLVLVTHLFIFAHLLKKEQ